MATPENPAEENRRLRRTMRDLVALSTLPAVWAGLGPNGIARSLADVLLNTLSLDLVYVRLTGVSGESVVEVVRTQRRLDAAEAETVRAALVPFLGSERADPSLTIPDPFGAGSLRVIVTRFGVADDHGVLVAASRRTDFPAERDRLLLGVGANQTAIVVQRGQADQQVREQAERLRTTLACIGDAVITTDTEGRITNLNAVAESLTGWPNAEAVSRPLDAVFRIVNEQTRRPVENPVNKVLREGAVVGLANHTVLIARDGTERPIDDSAAPIRCKEGEVVGCVLVFRDVTERRREEAALRESELRYRLVGQAANDAIWDWNLVTHQVTWNEGVRTVFGYTEGEVGLDASWWVEHIHPADRGRITHGIHAAIDGGHELWQDEYRFRRADGSYAEVFDRGRVVRESGTPVRMVGSMLDLTERKRSERTARFLAKASAALADLTDYESTLQKVASLAVPEFADWCAVDMLDEKGQRRRVAVTHADPTKVRLAKEVEERYPARPDAPHGIANVLRTGEPELVEDIPDTLLAAAAHDEEHLRLLRELGLRSYICVPVRSHGRTLGGISFVSEQAGRRYSAADLRVAQDLAHRAAVAIENAALYRALREADRRKDEFLATLAHELRNPLAPLRNALQIMKLSEQRDAVAQARSLMERQLGQMVRLVDDLLDVSRITRNKLELRKERVDLAKVVRDAVETSRPLIEQMGHTLAVTLPPHPVFVDADLTRLAQVFLNLLNNSAKYTPPGGRIWLTAERQGSDVVAAVRDSGVGIPADKLSTVFDLFSQVEGTMSRSQGGLGIGLSLVKRLVEMHGGSIQAHSAGPGQGSTFTVRLPVLIEAPQPRLDSDREEAAPRSTLRILIVDDNRDSADSLGMMLRLLGNDIHTAYDGVEALTVAEASRPQVVLLDIGLPRLNGYDACRRIREQMWGRGLVMIALTGWGQEEDVRRSHEAGFDHHMVKPVDPSALMKLLAELQAAKF